MAVLPPGIDRPDSRSFLIQAYSFLFPYFILYEAKIHAFVLKFHGFALEIHLYSKYIKTYGRSIL